MFEPQEEDEDEPEEFDELLFDEEEPVDSD